MRERERERKNERERERKKEKERSCVVKKAFSKYILSLSLSHTNICKAERSCLCQQKLNPKNTVSSLNLWK